MMSSACMPIRAPYLLGDRTRAHHVIEVAVGQQHPLHLEAEQIHLRAAITSSSSPGSMIAAASVSVSQTM